MLLRELVVVFTRLPVVSNNSVDEVRLLLRSNGSYVESGCTETALATLPYILRDDEELELSYQLFDEIL